MSLEIKLPKNNENVFDYIDAFAKYKNVKSELIVGNPTITSIPFISIIIPTYKRPDLLKESIDSALNQQKYNDYEIIVVDNEVVFDIETKTEKLLRSYESDKLYYYKNKKNIGMYGNWNRGIELARGKFVSLLHDDDVLCSDFLYSIVKVIKHYNFKGMVEVGADVIYKRQQNYIYGKPINDKFKVERLTFNELYFKNAINTTGFTFYKKYALKIGGFNNYGDFAFGIKFIQRYKALKISKVLVHYRIFRNESLNINIQSNLMAMTYYIRKHLANCNLFNRLFNFIFCKEYLLLDIENTNIFFGIKLDINTIFEKIGKKNYRKNYIKYYLFKIIYRFLRYIIFKLYP